MAAEEIFAQSVQTDLCSQIKVDWTLENVHFDYQGDGLAIDRNPFDGNTLIEWIRSLSPDLGQLTLETLTTGFTDEREAYVSLLNCSTVTAIAKATDTSDHPERYRGNLLIDGVDPFEEPHGLEGPYRSVMQHLKWSNRLCVAGQLNVIGMGHVQQISGSAGSTTRYRCLRAIFTIARQQ